MNLIRPARWAAVKPPAGSQIDWGHPLAQGLVACFPLNQYGGVPTDIVQGTRLGTIGSVAKWRPTGAYGGAGGGGSGGWVGTPAPGQKPTKQASILWRGVKVGAQYGQFAYYVGMNNTAGMFNSLCLDDSNTGTVRFIINDGASQQAIVGPAPASAPGLTRQWLGTTRSGLQKLYVDGLGAPYATGSVTYTAIDYTGASLGLCANPGDTIQSANCLAECAYLWARELKPDEAAWLYAEPYAFFVPPAPKPLYFPFEGAAAATFTPRTTMVM